MENNGLCSIIVPCYNAEKYVVNCVKHLHEQTYRQLEIILVDDGSIDNTFSLCKDLEAEYADVIAITHNTENGRFSNSIKTINRNKGLEATRNRGLEEASGEWVCFVDADDWIDNNTLAESIRQSKMDEADICLFGLEMLYEDRSFQPKSELVEGRQDIRQYLSSVGNRLPWEVFSCVGSKLYRRSFIEKHQLRFDREYRYYEDSAFYMCALSKNPVITNINKPFYKYIQSVASINHSYRKNLYMYSNRMIHCLESLFAQYDLIDEKEWYTHYRRLYSVFYSLRDELVLHTYAEFKQLRCEFLNDIEINETLNNGELLRHLNFKERGLAKSIQYSALILALLIKYREKHLSSLIH